ncbi:MAG: hypothetical protein M0P71_11125 [Melioribacteraceae bacterium]|nr:hypothetical protein [Melioribacteraceae bacterium]
MNNTNFYIPQNIFSAFVALTTPALSNYNFITKNASLITRELNNDKEAIGLIPSCELINNKNIFVSSKIAISFDGLLSNSYFYFKPNQKELSTIFLRGDVTLNEVLLSKILFSELYSTDPEFVIDTKEKLSDVDNYIIVGNENLDPRVFGKGMSLSDEIAELIDFPYVNFVVASYNQEKIEKLNKAMLNLDEIVEENLDKIIKKIDLSTDSEKFIRENFNSVYFEMTSNEMDALKELIKLLYYHGLIEDIFEISFA